MSCSDPGAPASGSDDDDNQDESQDGAGADEADDDEGADDEGDDGDDEPARPDASGGTRDGGQSAQPGRDASGDPPSATKHDGGSTRDAAADAGSSQPPGKDGGSADAAMQDASAEPNMRDAGPSNPSQGPIAALRGKTMYSSKPTGAATWLVNADAAMMQRLVEADMRAAGANRFPVFTLYRYYPNSGTNAAQHRAWVTSIAETIGREGGPCVVVVEPDAFALGPKDRPDVESVLNTAVGILKDKAPNAAVFLDIGHSNWIPVGTVLSRTKAYSNYARIDGWASNTSNFQPMQAELNFARMLYAGSNKQTIIDSSRNGRGTPPTTIFNPPDSEWDPGPPFMFYPNEPAVLFNYYNKPSNERD